MTIVNLTPHEINIHISREDLPDLVVNLHPRGVVPRVRVVSRSLDPIVHTYDGAHQDDVRRCEIPVTATTYGAVSDLPDPVPGTVYVVSRVVAEACPDRSDLLIPGEAVRDQGGRVIGCRGLCSLRGDA